MTIVNKVLKKKKNIFAVRRSRYERWRKQKKSRLSVIIFLYLCLISKRYCPAFGSWKLWRVLIFLHQPFFFFLIIFLRSIIILERLSRAIIIVIIIKFFLIIVMIKTRIDIILKPNLGHADSLLFFNPCYNLTNHKNLLINLQQWGNRLQLQRIIL